MNPLEWLEKTGTQEARDAASAAYKKVASRLFRWARRTMCYSEAEIGVGKDFGVRGGG